MTGALDRTVFWSSWDAPGFQELRLRSADGEIVANGLVLGLAKETPLRLAYKIKCWPDWRVRKVVLDCAGPAGTHSRMRRSDGRGRWRTEQGEEIAALAGCIDLDISATPFTNTLPIRRLALEPGETREVRIAYVHAPNLALGPTTQRYTCRAAGHYTYENAQTGFAASLATDADGLVLDYPELFRRVYPA